MIKKKPEETGIEFLRRLVSVANYTNEEVFDDLSVEETIKLIRACWDSEFDIYADALSPSERAFAARTGKLSKKAVDRLNSLYGD
jgi:hypothetical protein